MKIVVNRTKGKDCGYKLSKIACEYLGVESPYSFFNHEDRTYSKLVEAVEFLQEKVNGIGADLRVITVPDELESKDDMGRPVRHWHLNEVEGFEVIRENHRFW